MKAKKTNTAINILTALSLIGAGLGTLPIPSADLPMPASWRPYIMSAGFFGLLLRVVAVSIRDAFEPPNDPKP
jgi:hypothetical protein